MPGGNPANATVPAQNAIAQSPIDKLKADWAGYPPGKKAIYIGCPFIMLAALIFLFSDTPADATAKPAAANSAQTAPSAPTNGGMAGATALNNGMAGSTMAPGLQGMQGSTTDTPAGFQGGTLTPTTPTAATANIFGNPPPTASASATAASGSKPPPNGNATAAAGSSDAGTMDPAMGVEPKVKTDERKAADAWASGNYELATQMYDALAREQPGNPAFPAAAAILRRKLDAGVQ
jgi:hypothetical protein